MKTDMQIQQNVRDELQWDARVTATGVGVTVKDGMVTISGTVPHFMEKRSAEMAAQKVGGVKAVLNEIEVKFTDSSYERGDKDIAEAALNALSWNYQVPAGIKVSVSNGEITLRGSVEWEFQRQAAEDTVKSMWGVRCVNDEIELKSKSNPGDVKKRIEDAFKRSAASEGKGVTVAIDGDCVTLTGKVHCMAEKEDARWAAYFAPGVSRVVNHLVVNG